MELYHPLIALVLISVIIIFYPYIVMGIALVYALPILCICFLLFIEIQIAKCLHVRYIKKGKLYWTHIYLRSRVYFYEYCDEATRTIKSVFELFGGKSYMAIQVQKPNDVEEYVPKDEKDADNPASFSMKKLGATRKAKLQDDLVEVDEGTITGYSPNFVALEITRERLVGWENVKNPDGTDARFDADDVEASFDLLPDSIQDELIGNYGSAGQGSVQTDEEEE